MNATHLVWMTLPGGEVGGRGERVLRALEKLGLTADDPVALADDGAGDILPANTTATLADAMGCFDKATGGDDVGWRGSGGEASYVIGAFTVGSRRGLVLRFSQSDFYELDSAVKGGSLLELIASLRGTCGAREVVWARDMKLSSVVELLDSRIADLTPSRLDAVAAVAEVSEGLTDLMEIGGEVEWGGSLRFIARDWARPAQG